MSAHCNDIKFVAYALMDIRKDTWLRKILLHLGMLVQNWPEDMLNC